MRSLINYVKLATASPSQAPHTRSFVFTRTWSKHLRYPNFNLELAYSGNRFGAVLQGHYYQRSHGLVKPTSLSLLHTEHDLLFQEICFEHDGPFRFTVKAKGSYQFIAESDGDVFEIQTIRLL